MDDFELLRQARPADRGPSAQAVASARARVLAEADREDGDVRLDSPVRRRAFRARTLVRAAAAAAVVGLAATAVITTSRSGESTTTSADGMTHEEAPSSDRCARMPATIDLPPSFRGPDLGVASALDRPLDAGEHAARWSDGHRHVELRWGVEIPGDLAASQRERDGGDGEFLARRPVQTSSGETAITAYGVGSSDPCLSVAVSVVGPTPSDAAALRDEAIRSFRWRSTTRAR